MFLQYPKPCKGMTSEGFQGATVKPSGINIIENKDVPQKMDAEGVQRAIGKPSGIISINKKQETLVVGCPKGSKGRRSSPLE